MRVLYVEDHQDTAVVLGKLLEIAGYEVELAASCNRAREILQTGRIDVLVSDLSLPDGDGCSLMRDVASRIKIPGIAISGHASQRDRERATDAGFCEHLAKPIVFEQLRAALGRCAPDLPSPKVA